MQSVFLKRNAGFANVDTRVLYADTFQSYRQHATHAFAAGHLRCVQEFHSRACVANDSVAGDVVLFD
eukprot:10233258-Lingulodinium_polyedra.AAC.1